MNDRYSRQTLFKPIGEEGQKKISSKHVLIVGAGALGTGAAENLVRAGIGKLTILDRDYVEWSNLQRQQLYTEKDADTRLPKAVAARQRLQEVNSETVIDAPGRRCDTAGTGTALGRSGCHHGCHRQFRYPDDHQ